MADFGPVHGALLGAGLTVAVTVLIHLAKTKRREGQEHGISVALQERHTTELSGVWRRIDEIHDELDETKEKVIVLQVQVANLPNRDVLDSKLREMEHRFDERLKAFADQITETIERSTSHICPMTRRDD